jgi:hypothetical protein
MSDNKVILQLQKFLQKTKERKLPWKDAGSNVFRWIKQEGNRLFTTTLQFQQTGVIRTPGAVGVAKKIYTLTIQATNPNEIVFQVNTARDPYVFDILDQLFQEVTIASKESSADIIDKLLGDL